ncbi:hypothetical protein K491DRAFT_784971 [Lophiostoma macrostomum CBS 122681]|uniref:Uncharacterized protein n=1 Tax=Lophiostoma macrostomum CBS 122681 TaxID=1314788 RepID=A0A6A6SKR6_9PLEO|nr:hypothetical protein K491DRAFT_784971 [Lophiostoma macrostomum CBS 122681]
MNAQPLVQANDGAQCLLQHVDEYRQERLKLARQKGSLRHQLQLLQAKENTAKKHFDSICQKFATGESCKVSEMMQEKLPRELRDLVYEHLDFRHGHVCVKHYLHLLGRYNPQIVQESCNGMWPCNPGHWTPSMVDTIWNGVCSKWMLSSANQATFRELNEHLLGVSVIEFNENYHLIGSFFNMNIPELGLTPAATVHHALVTLPQPFSAKSKESILELLQPLRRLEWGSVVYFNINTGLSADLRDRIYEPETENGRNALADLRNCLEAFFPLFLELKGAGYTVCLDRPGHRLVSTETSDFTVQGTIDRVLGR